MSQRGRSQSVPRFRQIGSSTLREHSSGMQLCTVLWDQKHKPCWPLGSGDLELLPGNSSKDLGSIGMCKLLSGSECIEAEGECGAGTAQPMLREGTLVASRCLLALKPTPQVRLVPAGRKEGVCSDCSPCSALGWQPVKNSLTATVPWSPGDSRPSGHQSQMALMYALQWLQNSGQQTYTSSCSRDAVF